MDIHRGKKVGTERIWYGDKENIALGTEQEFWMVLPKAEIPHIKAKYTLDGKELTAPGCRYYSRQEQCNGECRCGKDFGRCVAYLARMPRTESERYPAVS